MDLPRAKAEPKAADLIKGKKKTAWAGETGAEGGEYVRNNHADTVVGEKEDAPGVRAEIHLPPMEDPTPEQRDA